MTTRTYGVGETLVVGVGVADEVVGDGVDAELVGVVDFSVGTAVALGFAVGVAFSGFGVIDGSSVGTGVSVGMGDIKITRAPASGVGVTIPFLVVRNARIAPTSTKMPAPKMSGLFSSLCIVQIISRQGLHCQLSGDDGGII